MNTIPHIRPQAQDIGEDAGGATVIAVADRMLATARQEETDFELWPIEEDALAKAMRDMMMQPFIEMLFYGEEEETGNVTLSTML
jgi:hypothetical protein